jgi:hypothetical protein
MSLPRLLVILFSLFFCGSVVHVPNDHHFFPSWFIQTANMPLKHPQIVDTNAVCCVVAVGPNDINQSAQFHAISVEAAIIIRGSILRAKNCSAVIMSAFLSLAGYICMTLL